MWFQLYVLSMTPYESQNRIGWKRPLKSSSPTINLTLPRPPLYHVPKHLIQTSFKYLQGWRLNHFPGQPVPVLDNPLGEVKFPNIQSKPPLVQLEAISSRPITCYLGEETDPHLATISFQVVVESDKVSPQPPFSALWDVVGRHAGALTAPVRAKDGNRELGEPPSQNQLKRVLSCKKPEIMRGTFRRLPPVKPPAVQGRRQTPDFSACELALALPWGSPSRGRRERPRRRPGLTGPACEDRPRPVARSPRALPAPGSGAGRRMMKLRGGFQQRRAAGEEPAPAGAALFITRRGGDDGSPCAGDQEG
ncbi:hypothetical protein QYF61_011428 [Mycteria americana]|uniref:Uncharacterized protein n=1 Tax=Mycteria americana TaxID=33587 RepID=A0AAN7NLT6_MYCAM|nr:hypothetical protein QYF61_011428 [Mycteria americana]